MKFVGPHVSEFPTLLTQFISITDWSPWKKRIDMLNQQYAKNPLLEDLIVDYHWIEAEMAAHRQRVRATGRMRKPSSSTAAHNFQAFVACTARVYSLLSDKGKKTLRGMLIDGLKSEYGLLSVHFEIEIAGALMSYGSDVTFSDIENGGGFDFLARREGLEAEVECKLVTADIGRKVHRSHAIALYQRLRPVMEDWAEKASGGVFVRIVVPDRLHPNQQQQNAIVEQAKKAISGMHAVSKSENCRVEIEEIDLSEIPFGPSTPRQEAEVVMRNMVEEKIGNPNSNILVFLKPGKSVIVFVVGSEKSDRVLDRILRHLKGSGSSQFSGDRPGVLCVRLVDISVEDIHALAQHDRNEGQPTGLAVVANVLFQDRPHIHTVMFTTPGDVDRKRTVNGPILREESTGQSFSYTFTNSSHPLIGDERLILIGDKPG